MSTHAIEVAKTVGDVTSIGVVIGTLTTWLPPIASGLTIIWVCLRIYETQTFQAWLKKRKK